MAAKATILAIDDDSNVTEMLEGALKQAGYAPRIAENADQGFAILTSEPVDLVLLDFQLPGISGLKLLEIIRQDPRTAEIPVMMLTVKKSELDKVAGLKTGADDYLIKPFSVKELLARVEALLRRSRHSGRTGRLMEIAGIRIDFDAHEVAVKNKRVDLTPLEFALLARLAQRPGQVLTYQMLSDALSEGSRIMTSESLYSHVKNLRQKLGSAGNCVETVHGIGYKFRTP